MTAPIVPPSTIMAAVGCRIWAIFPPSSSKPARIPPTARNIPTIVLLSTRSSFRTRVDTVIERGTARHSHCSPGICGDRQQSDDYGTPEFDHTRDHFIRRLMNQDLVPAHQRDHGVGIALDTLDQIRVHGDLLTV